MFFRVFSFDARSRLLVCVSIWLSLCLKSERLVHVGNSVLTWSPPRSVWGRSEVMSCSQPTQMRHSRFDSAELELRPGRSRKEQCWGEYFQTLATQYKVLYSPLTTRAWSKVWSSSSPFWHSDSTQKPSKVDRQKTPFLSARHPPGVCGLILLIPCQLLPVSITLRMLSAFEKASICVSGGG